MWNFVSRECEDIQKMLARVLFTSLPFIFFELSIYEISL